MASANEVLSVPIIGGDNADPYDSADNMAAASQNQPVYDFLSDAPRCKCCPYGYHVDVGFVKYAEDAKRGKYLRHLQQIQKYKNRLRLTMESFYKQHGRYPHMYNPPDLIRGSDTDSDSISRHNSGPTIEEHHSDEDTFALFGTMERHSKVKQPQERPRTPKGSSALEIMGSRKSSISSSSKETVRVKPHSPLIAEHCVACHRQQVLAARSHVCPHCRPGFGDTCDFCTSYVCPQCAPAPNLSFVEKDDSNTVQITKEQLANIREQMARSLTRLRELEEKAHDIPVLQMRIKLLHEEKKLLQMQVEEKEKETEEVGILYENSLRNVSALEDLRRQEGEAYVSHLGVQEERIKAVEYQQSNQIPKPEMRDQSVGNGDIRSLYFLQDSGDDFEVGLPENVLETLQRQWEASYMQRVAVVKELKERQAGGSRKEVGVLATAAAGQADVCQFVDMDDEEWSLQESEFSDRGQELAWYQEQIASSRERHSIIRYLRSAYQFNSVEFKNLIIRLLAKNVRSQAVQVVPESSDCALVTDHVARRSVGVGDCTVDVVVKPFKQLYTIGVETRPMMANKMTFTDRTFRYDAGTNTARLDSVSVSQMTEADHRVSFTLGTQTDGQRTRDQSSGTDPVNITEAKSIINSSSNTESVRQLSIAVGTELGRRERERGVGTEPPLLYEAAVSTDQVLMLDKMVNTVGISVDENEAPVTAESPEVMLSESWEEYSVTDNQGQVIRQTVTPVTRSRTVGSKTEVTRESRSASVGAKRGEWAYSGGSYEFGGGTVRNDVETSYSSSSKNGAISKRRHASERDEEAVERSYARSRMPLSSARKETVQRDVFADIMANQSEATSSLRTTVDVKETEFYTSCLTLAQWMDDSTTKTSKQMNEAEASIKQAWFRLAGSRASRPEVVEPYLQALRELGSPVLEKVVNLADDTGNTCMHYAISQANWPMVSLILRSSPVHLDRLNRTGYSALMLAALCDLPSHEFPTLAVDLARAASNVDQASSSGAGQTALMLAASHGRIAMVESLLASGASPNIKDKEGSTALMCASEHGHLEVVRALLARPETDAALTDGEGSTALSIAMENNHREIALLIYARTNLGKSSASSSIMTPKSQQDKISSPHLRSRKATRSVFEATSSLRSKKTQRRTVQSIESATVFKYK